MLQANEMLQNDPLLHSLVQRLQLTSVEVAIISFILLPAVLFLWCLGTGTLRINSSMANPKGHGFWSPINSYLLVVPFLNFAIFEYYNVYAQTIRGLCSPDVLSCQAQDIFAILTGVWGKSATVISFSASLVLALVSLSWNLWLEKPKPTNWLCRIGSPRPIAFYFLALFFFIELGIVFSWFLRDVLIWTRLNEVITHAQPQPFNPDRMFGFENISTLAQWSFIVIALISLLVILWILGARITLKKSNLYANPAYLSAALAIVMLGPAVVIMPLRSSHNAMFNAKKDRLSRLSAEIQKISKDIQEQVSAVQLNEPQLSALLKKLDAENRLYDFVNGSYTWPISGSTLGSFPLAFLSPVFVPLLVEIGKKYVTKSFG